MVSSEELQVHTDNQEHSSSGLVWVQFTFCIDIDRICMDV